MTRESGDSIVGMIRGEPVVVCFQDAPVKVLKVIVRRSKGVWSSANPGDGTIEFLGQDIPGCSKWCFSFIVGQLRSRGWKVNTNTIYAQYDWDRVPSLTGSLA